jgi:hypothetical protein
MGCRVDSLERVTIRQSFAYAVYKHLLDVPRREQVQRARFEPWLCYGSGHGT